MIFEKPETLLLLESLAVRMGAEGKYLHRAQKGFEGEVLFRKQLDSLKPTSIILSDLYLEPTDGQKFQIDHLLIIGDVLFIYEVKNYGGEWDYDDEQFTVGTEKALPNPLIKLARTKSNLKQH